MHAVAEQFRALEGHLNDLFLERRDLVRGLIVSLLVEEHLVIIGPWGAAKSEILRTICAIMETKPGEYFEDAARKDMPRDELFGPVSAEGFRKDTYRRNTALMLPEARIAFLDEAFDGSGVLLRGMNSLMNERVFRNGTELVKAPLETLVAASNRFPDERDNLGAFWDRFMLRYEVGYVTEQSSFEKMLAMAAGGRPETDLEISRDELEAARGIVGGVDVEPVLPLISKLWQKLQARKITPSDRRWTKGFALVRANAFLEGRGAANAEDLLILAHSLWHDADHRQKVRKIVTGFGHEQLDKAQDHLDEAREAMAKLARAEEHERGGAANSANRKLYAILDRLLDLQTQAEKAGRSTAGIEALVEAVRGMREEASTIAAGLDDAAA